MKVMMLSKALVVGAYQHKVAEMAALPDIDLTVIVPPSWRDERGVLALETSSAPNYRLVVTPIRFNGNFHLHYYPQLANLFNELQPDLVHLDEEPYNLATWLGLRAAKRVAAKVVWFSWQNLQRNYPPPFRWFEADVLRRSDGALFGNRAAAAVFAAKGYRGPQAVIPQFGVDPALFPARQGWLGPQGKLKIAYMGRLVPEKGVDLILQALAALGDGSTLAVAGSGPEQARLQALAQQLGVAEQVTWTAWMPSTAMADFLAQADVLVLPSRSRPNWQEQFGRALIEAMAVGLPVVGANSGEIPNVMGAVGLVFSEGAVDELVAALIRLRDDAALYAELVQAGRARVLGQYTQAQIAAQTVAFYRQILQGI